jgi:hypothetical protein
LCTAESGATGATGAGDCTAGVWSVGNTHVGIPWGIHDVAGDGFVWLGSIEIAYKIKVHVIVLILYNFANFRSRFGG